MDSSSEFLIKLNNPGIIVIIDAGKIRIFFLGIFFSGPEVFTQFIYVVEFFVCRNYIVVDSMFVLFTISTILDWYTKYNLPADIIIIPEQLYVYVIINYYLKCLIIYF